MAIFKHTIIHPEDGAGPSQDLAGIALLSGSDTVM